MGCLDSRRRSRTPRPALRAERAAARASGTGSTSRDDDPRLLSGAVGWIVAETVDQLTVGDHVLFVGAMRSLEAGPGRGSLVYFDRRYVSL